MPKHTVSSGPSAVRQRAKIVAAGILAGKTKVQAQLDAGYSPATAHNQNAFQQPAFRGTIREALDDAQGRLDEVARIHGRILHSRRADIALHAVELNYRVRGLLNSKLDVDVKGPISVIVREFVLTKKENEPAGSDTSKQ